MPHLDPFAHVVADICVIPLGVGVSVSKYVIECQKVFSKFPIKTQLHAYGTNLEGSWEDVFAAITECHRRLHEMGAPRISTAIKVGTRTDKDSSIAHKINAVQAK